jgi:hypothetical protein
MNEKDKNQFTIEVSSDLDYEKMVINLNYCNNQVAILNCDAGVDQTKIEILDKYEEKIIWSFDYQSFIKALNKAYEKLKEVNS